MFLPMVHQMIAEAAGIADGGRVRPEIAGDTTTPGIILNEGPAGSSTSTRSSRRPRAALRASSPTISASAWRSRPVLPAPRGALAPPDGRLRDDEIWPWLALGLIGVLLVENFLANRTAA